MCVYVCVCVYLCAGSKTRRECEAAHADKPHGFEELHGAPGPELDREQVPVQVADVVE